MFLTTFTQGLASTLILSFFSSLSNPKTPIQSIILFTMLTVLNYIFAIFILMLLKLINKKYNLSQLLNDSLIKKFIFISLILLNLAYATLYNITKYLHVEQEYIKLTTLVIIVTIAFMAIGISMAIYSHIKEIKTELKLEQMNERNAYINELEKNNDDLHKFKHDYKNLLHLCLLP
ncbi:hypothetical protein [Companilactobacillus muriivasis]|uniref:hypothetical protein n=1 Tax=Companilactobacillus muriivasis TaxID=3081444 RepID=UPI0030C6A0CA